MRYRAYSGHAQVDPDNVRPLALCDRCKQVWNHDRLTFQYDFQGRSSVNQGILVCPNCLDIPNPTSKVITIPLDPEPVFNARKPKSTTP